MTSLLDRSLPQIAAALERAETSAGELASAVLERHERVGAALDAYQVWDAEELRRQAAAVDAARREGRALGPLAGVPLSVKDLFGVAGWPTYAGTARRLPAVWEREGPLVQELRRQRALLVGKTRMVELAFGGLGTNPHWGTPVNPWDPDVQRVPGGSSCGAGVSVQEGSALVAVGTDTACSVRTPAAWTGCVGLKATLGHWSTDGMVPLSHTLDSVGILTRTVEDAAFAFAALEPEGAPARFLAQAGRRELRGLALGVVASAVWEECAADVRAPVEAALRELEAGGARVVDVALPEFDEARDLYSTGVIAATECSRFLIRELPDWLELLHPTVGERLRGSVGGEDEYRGALEQRRALVASARERLAATDLLVVPSVPIGAPALAAVQALEDYAAANRHTSRATSPANVLGLCALSLPVGLDAGGVPVGLQLVARGGEDAHLLAAALAVERALGTGLQRLGRAPRCR